MRTSVPFSFRSILGARTLELARSIIIRSACLLRLNVNSAVQEPIDLYFVLILSCIQHTNCIVQPPTTEILHSTWTATGIEMVRTRNFNIFRFRLGPPWRYHRIVICGPLPWFSPTFYKPPVAVQSLLPPLCSFLASPRIPPSVPSRFVCQWIG